MTNTKKRFSLQLYLLLIVCCLPFVASSQPSTSQPPPRVPASLPAYWQQEVHYNIRVALDDQNHSLKGFESLEYINHSPDTLGFIWFHLWPNAYKDNTTALFKQLSQLEERKARLKKIKENGFINQLAFTIDGEAALTETHPKYIDIVKLILPARLPPGGKITIATPFFVKIPSYFSRLGHEGHSYMITQWYPKPAVYDRKGWHEFPYLDQGEFYSEFGSFDVHITLPADYVVGATGTLLTKDELDRYKSIGAANFTDPTGKRTAFAYHPAHNITLKTLEYQGDDIHDFAWFADKTLRINYDTLQLASGRVIDVFSYYRAAPGTAWSNSISFIKDAVRHYSAWIGEYAYPVVSALEGPGNVSSGGMEYPMITLITSPGAGAEELDGVITHEVGHNWFYGMLGSNEREHPWMDEGINTYYEFRYEAEKYRGNSAVGSLIPDKIKQKELNGFLDAIYSALNQMNAATTEPIETPATAFTSELDYGAVEYVKTAVWMYLLESSLGTDVLDKGMQLYFSNWKFRHPYPEDLQNSLEESSRISLNKLFDLLHKKGSF
jgi:hypothetical protein